MYHLYVTINMYIIYITYLYISVTRSNLNLKIFFKSAIFQVIHMSLTLFILKSRKLQVA